MTYTFVPRFDIPELTQQLNRMEQKLDLIAAALAGVAAQTGVIVTDLSAITNEVQENGDAVASAVSLLGSLSQQIRDLSTDPAALQALADQLDANTQSLAEAVVANTPAAPEPTP